VIYWKPISEANILNLACWLFGKQAGYKYFHTDKRRPDSGNIHPEH
jgi:hypothetical protein